MFIDVCTARSLTVATVGVLGLAVDEAPDIALKQVDVWRHVGRKGSHRGDEAGETDDNGELHVEDCLDGP